MCSVIFKLIAYFCVWAGLQSYRADDLAYAALTVLFLWEFWSLRGAWLLRRECGEAEERLRGAARLLRKEAEARALEEFLWEKLPRETRSFTALDFARSQAQRACPDRNAVSKALGANPLSKRKRLFAILRGLTQLRKDEGLEGELHLELQNELREGLFKAGATRETVDEASWIEPAIVSSLASESDDEEITWIGEEEATAPSHEADADALRVEEAALAEADAAALRAKEAALAEADAVALRAKEAALAVGDLVPQRKETEAEQDGGEGDPGLLPSVVEAFMEEGNVKWVEVLASAFYLVAFVIGVVLLVSRWGDISPLWRYGALLGLTVAVGGAGKFAGSFLGLDGTARALAAVTALLLPMNFLAMGLLFRPEGSLLVSLPSFFVALVFAAAVLWWLHRTGCACLLGRPSDGLATVAVLLAAPSCWLDCPLSLLGPLLLALAGAALTWGAGLGFEGDEALRFWRRFFVVATGAWSLFVAALAWSMRPMDPGALWWGGIVFLLALQGLGLALLHRGEELRELEAFEGPWWKVFHGESPDPRSIRASIASLSLLGFAMLLARWGSPAATVQVGAFHVLGGLVLGGWACLTGLSALNWISALVVALGVFEGADAVHGIGFYDALFVLVLLFALGEGWRQLRLRLFAAGSSEGALALPFQIYGAVLAVVLTVLSVTDPNTGRWITALLALGAGGALFATRFRALLWPIAMESALSIGLFAWGGLGSHEDHFFVLLAWILAGLGLFFQGLEGLFRGRLGALREIEGLKGQDQGEAFADVAGLTLVGAFASLLFLLFDPAVAGAFSEGSGLRRFFPLAAWIGALAWVLRGRLQPQGRWGIGLVIFGTFALSFGPLQPWAWTRSESMLRWAWISLVFLVLGRWLRSTGRPMVLTASFVALPPFLWLLPAPFLGGASDGAAMATGLTALAMAGIAWQMGRLFSKAWWSLPLLPTFLVMACDGLLFAGRDPGLRLMGVSGLFLVMASLSRWPRLRLFLGREGRRLGAPSSAGRAAHGLADAGLLVGILVGLGLLLPALGSRLSGDSCLATAFLASLGARGPFLAPLMAASTAVGLGFLLLARFFSMAAALRFIASFLLTVGVVGQGVRLLPNTWSMALHPVLLVGMALLLSRKSRAASRCLGAWVLFLAFFPWRFHGGPELFFSRLVGHGLAFGGAGLLFHRDASLRRSLGSAWAFLLSLFGLSSWIVTGLTWALGGYVFMWQRGLVGAPIPGPLRMSRFLQVEAWGFLLGAALLVLLLRRQTTFPLRPLHVGAYLALAMATVASLLAELTLWSHRVHGGGSIEAAAALGSCVALSLFLLRSDPTNVAHELMAFSAWIFGFFAIHVASVRLGLPLPKRPVAVMVAAAAVAAFLCWFWNRCSGSRKDPKKSGHSPFLPRVDALEGLRARWAGVTAFFLILLFLVTGLRHDFSSSYHACSSWAAFILAGVVARTAGGRSAFVFAATLNWAVVASAAWATAFASRATGGSGPWTFAALASTLALMAAAAFWRRLRERAETRDGQAGRPFLSLGEGELEKISRLTRVLSLAFAICLLPQFLSFRPGWGEALAHAILTGIFVWGALLEASELVSALLALASTAVLLSGTWAFLAWVRPDCVAGNWMTVLPFSARACAALILAIAAWGWGALDRFLAGREGADPWRRCLGALVPHWTAMLLPAAVFVFALSTLRQVPGVWTWLPSLLALIVVTAHYLHEAWRRDQELLVYVALFSAAAVYGYLKVRGLIGHGFWGQLGMAVGAFALLAAAHWTRSHGLGVFSRPFERASLLLPLVLIARTGLGLGGRIDWLGAPGLERFGLVAMASAYYAMVGRRHRWASVFSMILGNLALGILFRFHFQWNDLSRHLDVYLIPAGLSLVLFSRLHAAWIGPRGRKGLRLLGLLIVYGAPTWHCLAGARLVEVYVLMTLGVLGFLAGLGLRVRHFFLFGLVFMAVALGTLVLRVWQMQVSSFTFFFFLVLALGFFTHAALLRKWREGYRALLDDFAAWD